MVEHAATANMAPTSPEVAAISVAQGDSLWAHVEGGCGKNRVVEVVAKVPAVAKQLLQVVGIIPVDLGEVVRKLTCRGVRCISRWDLASLTASPPRHTSNILVGTKVVHHPLRGAMVADVARVLLPNMRINKPPESKRTGGATFAPCPMRTPVEALMNGPRRWQPSDHTLSPASSKALDTRSFTPLHPPSFGWPQSITKMRPPLSTMA